MKTLLRKIRNNRDERFSDEAARKATVMSQAVAEYQQGAWWGRVGHGPSPIHSMWADAYSYVSGRLGRSVERL